MAPMSYHISPSPRHCTGLIPTVMGLWKVQVVFTVDSSLFLVVWPLFGKCFSLNYYFIAYSVPLCAGKRVDSNFMRIPSIFKLSGLISLLFGAEWRGACSSSSQSLIKAIPICGTWETCLLGRNTRPVFNWTEDFFLMFLITFVEVWVKFTNVIARRIVSEAWIYSRHIYQWWASKSLHWMPQERLCKKTVWSPGQYSIVLSSLLPGKNQSPEYHQDVGSG